ncbi:MAG: tetratricopeptide repeat protein [Candidatus Cyclobacteriaceae bacterium M3_2C_046]
MRLQGAPDYDRDTINRKEALYQPVFSLNFSSLASNARYYNGPEEIYSENLSQLAGFFLNAPEKGYELFLEREKERLQYLERNYNETNWGKFVKAELFLQGSLLRLRQKDHISGFWKLKRAHDLTSQILESDPSFVPSLKTLGVIEILLGLIPDQYQWGLKMLGLPGDIETGLIMLEKVIAQEPMLKEETLLIRSMVQAYLVQQYPPAIKVLKQLSEDGNQLATYFLSLVYLKAGQGEKAMQQFSTLLSDHELPHLFYLEGEVYLQKGLYGKAIIAYQKFIEKNRSGELMKDSYYKTGICHYILGETEKQHQNWQKAREIDHIQTEADKYAASQLAKDQLPPVQLVQLRYHIDGGYFGQAKQIIQKWSGISFNLPEHQAEFLYRQGRWYQKQGHKKEAITLYQRLTKRFEGLDLYFIPHAILQLGYLLSSEHPEKARSCFKKVLEYKNYEYEYSISRKARVALKDFDDK